MSNKQIGLLVIAVLTMALLAFLNQGPGEQQDVQVGTKVLDGLEASLDRVERLSFKSAGQSTTLVRGESGWTVTERDGFPADFTKLSAFLRNVAGATLLERKTANPDNFELLGVTDVDSAESPATLITIAGDKSYELITGNASTSREGRFVRKRDESQVWLTSDLGEISADPASWIDALVLQVDAEQVVKASHTSNGETLTVTRQEEAGFKVEDLPAGAKLQYDTVGDTLSRAIGSLRATDVRLRGEEPFEPAMSAIYELSEGARITCKSVNEDGSYWLRINAEGETLPEGVSPERLARYEFKVAEYTFKQLSKSMADMIALEEDQTDGVE